ncbi:SDR family oxidoreductase [bacterium]|nr:SDR family oxidoreductase [bacterium]MBU1652636.1 SDR family oxidoreductase [bacterium]
MSCYLVTGGAGFIGSNLVAALLQRGHEVRVVDNFATGRHINLKPFENDIKLYELDIGVELGLKEAFAGVDYVLHQAALPSVPRSIADPVGSFVSSARGTLNVLESARATGVKRLVFASSSSIYGSNPELPKVESMRLEPLSPYAAAKLSAETYCQVYYKVYGVQTVALRYFNVFGPNQDPDSQYAAVIPKFIRAALRGETLTINGDGSVSRDFTYIDNIVQGNILAAESDAGAGEVFNIACGDRISLNEMVATIESFVGHPVDKKYDPPRAGDVPHSQANIDKITELLGYKPTISFTDGMEQTFEYFKKIFS